MSTLNMCMSSMWLIATVTVLYSAISMSYMLKKNWAMACVWAGYAFANGGFLYMEIMKK